jgi:hypothetical protein
MAKNLVLCADGTCNVFGRSSSNVARLPELIALGDRGTQVVVYDQGVGTRVGQHKKVEKFRDALGGSGALDLLPPPKESVWRPWTWPSLITAMAYGTGLEVNVGQLYQASYGGLKPVILPHLRHNPGVCTVRHALALDEERGWFELTTWGWLDSDRQGCAAGSRLASADIEHIRQQDVAEVWFNGCHADIGGGGKNRDSGAIALRWMLGEAHHFGLQLNDNGRTPFGPHARRTPVGQAITVAILEADRMQGARGDHECRPLARAGHCGTRRFASSAARFIRDKTLWYHESVTDPSRFEEVPQGVAVTRRPTLRLHATPQPEPARPATVVAGVTASQV